MSEPTLNLMPVKSAIRKAQATEMDLVIRILPPSIEKLPERPTLNLGLVIDRSGSMGEGSKMPYALEAARFAIEQLLPTDRVSVTIFDNQIETIVPNQPAADKSGMAARLRSVVPRGSTALHGGWAEGASQVEKGLAQGALNRVLLLSDGLANVGLTDLDPIATEVSRLKDRGVSTSTIGVGADYNEDLMQAMGQAGDGNYYFIDDPKRIPEIFGAELRGLVATLGTDVRLTLEPQHGVEVVDVLNDLPVGPTGSYRMPNLVVGSPVDVVVKLKVPAREEVTEVLRVRLEWSAMDIAGRKTVARSLIVPAVDPSEYDAMKPDADASEKVQLMEVGRIKLRASKAMAAGDWVGTRAQMNLARAQVMAMPQSPFTSEELHQLSALEADLDEGNAAFLIKRAKFQKFSRNRGSSLPVEPDNPHNSPEGNPGKS